MATRPPAPIPFPWSSFPGANPQEGAGRLINCYSEPLGEPQKPTGPAPQVWRRSAGMSQFATSGQTGYRGGLSVNNLAYEAFSGNASTVDANGTVTSLGTFPGTKKISIARNLSAAPDVVAVDLDNGAYILNTAAVANATATATVGGTTLTTGDTVSLLFVNPSVANLPVTVTYTLGGGETTTTVATGLKNAINNNQFLAAASITATSAAAIITITEPGAVGNGTVVSYSTTGVGNETVTFSPVSGTLSGGAGVTGITFTGTPLSYTGLSAMPQANSVCFQDGYFFFTIGNNQCFATGINTLQMNALTFINVSSRSDVSLLRGIAFSGLLWLFTTGHCEIWQDTAAPYPGFPYTRLVVIDYGLIQANAIAGWDTGFSELCWVAQDFGVYWCTSGSYAPQKISPADLDRLIEAQIRAGNTLEASVYTIAGKKFWVLSSPAWTWEFNLDSKRWNERFSLQTSGSQGRWRGTGGHPAFGKWLLGDVQSGNLLWVDNASYTENGAPQLMRIESGPVKDFPNQIRIARADFEFDMGVGQPAGLPISIANAANNGGGLIRLTLLSTAGLYNGLSVNVAGVAGTTEANGQFTINVIDIIHVDLVGSAFVHAYTSGGTLTPTPPANVVNPVVAISRSKDGAVTFGNPLIRSLGAGGRSLRVRASVKNLGLSGPMGDRWRLDVSDAVYTGFTEGTQSSDPREIGA